VFYALYDTTAREGNPGYGFANAKFAAAFTTKGNLDAFLAFRAPWDLSARRIPRREALKLLEFLPDTRDRGLYLNPDHLYGHGGLAPILLVKKHGAQPAGNDARTPESLL
jgi:hypothetical protein